MNIGEVARASGLPAKTIRYYEEIGLIRPDRQFNGYRVFDETHLHKLRFLQRARNLGFTVRECSTLLALYEDKSRASAEVKSVAEKRLNDLDQKMQELQSMQTILRHLISSCHGDDRPDCPILDELAKPIRTH